MKKRVKKRYFGLREGDKIIFKPDGTEKPSSIEITLLNFDIDGHATFKDSNGQFSLSYNEVYPVTSDHFLYSGGFRKSKSSLHVRIDMYRGNYTLQRCNRHNN